MFTVSSRSTQVSSRLLSLATRLHEIKPRVNDSGKPQGFPDFLRRYGLYGYLAQHRECWPSLGSESSQDFNQELRDYYLRTTGFAFRAAGALHRIIARLADDGVPSLTFKGVGWSLVLHGSVAIRPFGDIDLFVPYSQREQVQRTLATLGCTEQQPKGSKGQKGALCRFLKTQGYRVPNDFLNLDVHYRLWSQWISYEVPFEEAWSRRAYVEPDGMAPLPVLCPDDAIVFACFNGFQDGWGFPKALLDLALYLELYPTDWARLSAIAKERSPLVSHGVAFAVYLLGARPPEGWKPPFSAEEARKRFEQLFAQLEPPQLELLATEFWSGSKFLQIKRSLGGILTPSYEDVYSIDLPEGLTGCYILVRLKNLIVKLVKRRGVLK